MSDSMIYARFGYVDDSDAKVEEVPEGWNPLTFDPDDRSLVYLDSLPKEGSFYKWLSRSGQEGCARLKDAGCLCFHFYPNHAEFELSDAVAWQPIDSDGGYEHGKKPDVCPSCGFAGTFTSHPVYMSDGRVVHICPKCYEEYCCKVRKLYAQAEDGYGR